VGDIGCTTNQIAKWDDAQSTWVCSDELATLLAKIAALEAKLVHVTTVGTEITISGANLHVVNGMGSTESTNSLGNVIIGYNEPRTPEDPLNYRDDARTGSHMLVVGAKQNYVSFASIVVGRLNTTGGRYSSVSGGYASFALGDYSSVSGGSGNGSYGVWSSVSGGRDNWAYALYASISGGYENSADGDYSSVTGGKQIMLMVTGPQLTAGTIIKLQQITEIMQRSAADTRKLYQTHTTGRPGA
jgi:hypothetical protein